MELDEIRYALAKQIESIQSVNTNYGEIELDHEMREAVKITLERMLKRKIDEITGYDLY